MKRMTKLLFLGLILGVLFTHPAYGAHDFENKSISASRRANAGWTKFMALEQVKLEQVRARAYNRVEISWKEVPMADGYRIYRKERSEEWKKIYTVSAAGVLSCEDAAVVPGKTYTYTVQAFHREEGKTVWSAYDRKGLTVKVPAVPASKMKSVVSEGYNRVKITWKPISGVSGYRVYRKIDGQGWKALKTLGAVSSYLDKTVEPGVKYFYRVRAYYIVKGQKKWGGYGVDETGVIPELPVVKLKKVTAAAYNKLNITWSPAEGAAGYGIYMYQKEKGTWKQIGTSTKTFFSHMVQTGKTYRYTVRAFRIVKGKIVYGGYDKKGISGKTVPDTPELVSIEQTAVNKVKIRWKKALGATNYYVCRKNTQGKWQKVAELSGGNTVEYTQAASSRYPLIVGKSYTYTVRSYTQLGQTYGGFSSEGMSVSILSDTDWALKRVTDDVLKSITTSCMTRSQRLSACWSYITGGRFHYAGKYPNLNQKGWQRSLALNMLITHSGNCYGFACGFAALAEAIGYDPVVVCGRVSGSRDGAADGMTRHAWVRIDGRYYDPEAQYAGWARGIYNSGSYPIWHTVQRYVEF